MSGHVYRNYRMLTEQQKDLLTIQVSPCSGYFIYEGERLPLELRASGDTVTDEYTIDNVNEWDPMEQEQCIQQTITLNSSGLLKLYDGNDAIALRDAHLGVAALWKVDKSYVNGCVALPVDITYDGLKKGDGTINATLTLRFAPGELAGNLTVCYEVYLKERSIKSQNGIASVVGTRFGAIAKPLLVHVDGTGSVFPIIHTSQAGAPLWWLDSEGVENPLEDFFTPEYISIVLNAAHRDYKLLMDSEGIYNTPLYTEVLASAIEELFRRMSSEYPTELNEANPPEGTIAGAIKYMKECMELNGMTSQEVHTKVRAYIRSTYIKEA